MDRQFAAIAARVRPDAVGSGALRPPRTGVPDDTISESSHAASLCCDPDLATKDARSPGNSQAMPMAHSFGSLAHKTHFDRRMQPVVAYYRVSTER